MQKTYHSVSGQSVREQSNRGVCFIKIEERMTDYVEKSGCCGADTFANPQWHTDKEELKANLKSWSYYPSRVRFVEK